MSTDRTHLSRTFLVLLLIQVPLAVVTISASILSFSVHAAPSAVAIAVTILHPLLALFYSSRARGHRLHLYVTLFGLVVCTGLLCIPLAFFARRVHMVNRHPEDATRTVSAWAKVGSATTSLSILLDLALAVVLVYPRRQYALPESEKASFITASSDTPPQLPPLSSLNHHRISFPDRPPTASPSPNPNAHIPPTIMLVPESDSDSDGRTSPAPIPVQPAATAVTASKRVTRSLSTKTLPPLPPVTPPQQHQASMSPAVQPPSHLPPYPSTPTPSPPTPSPIDQLSPITQPTSPPSQQPQQQQPSPSPSPSPTALRTLTPTQPPRPTSLYTYDPTQPLNRIALLLALTSHQLGPGNWPATEAVLTLLRIWASGGGAMNRGVGDINLGLSGNGNSGGNTGAKGNGRGVTALAHACLVDLSQRVWAAQRGGTCGSIHNTNTNSQGSPITCTPNVESHNARPHKTDTHYMPSIPNSTQK
ncbi:hypothetical protein B0J18DRAFT_454059 [Chaetomium sp. MPI-SDFR-AT-0129]|nr:hypothetical protein B0J18DRAFT_454059 [Chaetomium sp. MPI-SDFR-AT-0129]